MRALVQWPHDAPEGHCDVLEEAYDEVCQAHNVKFKAHEAYSAAQHRYYRFQQISKDEPMLSSFEVFQEKLTDMHDAVAITQGHLNVAEAEREKARIAYELAVKDLAKAWIAEVAVE